MDGHIKRIEESDRPEMRSIGGIPKNSIQWEFETRQALLLMLYVADGLGICGFFSAPEESSASKSLVHSIVVAEVEHELGLRNRYVRTLVGNICIVASNSTLVGEKSANLKGCKNL